MSARSRLEQKWYETSHSPRPLDLALRSLAVCYRAGLRVRSLWWQTRRQPAPVATIRVGNLTVGGNGKTPLTLFLAQRLTNRGLHVGIVSRGYRAAHRGRPLLVANRGTALVGVDEAGDEPLMMAHRFDGPIAVARRRLDAVELLVRDFALDAIILDDGFQHLRLRRDLDIVAINDRRRLGNCLVLPAGPLREPASALARADFVVIVGRRDTPAIERTTVAGRPTLRASLEPSALVTLSAQGWVVGPLMLDGRRVVAVSGVADPDGFIATLTAHGAQVVQHLRFPDHHRYSLADWLAISRASTTADLVVTTEKDLPKLEDFAPRLKTLCAVRLEVTMAALDEEQLIATALARIERRPVAGLSPGTARSIVRSLRPAGRV